MPRWSAPLTDSRLHWARRSRGSPVIWVPAAHALDTACFAGVHARVHGLRLLAARVRHVPPPTPVGKAGFEVWALTLRLVCVSNILQTGPSRIRRVLRWSHKTQPVQLKVRAHLLALGEVYANRRLGCVHRAGVFAYIWYGPVSRKQPSYDYNHDYHLYHIRYHVERFVFKVRQGCMPFFDRKIQILDELPPRSSMLAMGSQRRSQR